MTSPHESWLSRSDGLHSRVQSFIRSAPESRDTLETLALEIARFQADFIPGYARLVAARQSRLDYLSTIPAVPVDAFRLARIAAHPAEADVVRYHTSGTTSGQPGLHFFRRTDTYRTSAVAWGKVGLLEPGVKHAAVVALLPETTRETSSLSAMANMFMEEFDPFANIASANALPTRWLLSESGIDVEGLQAHLERARAANQPLIVVATVIALVQLLDQLGPRRLDIWPHVVVMPTGGFKGKIREIATPELRAQVSLAFGIADGNIVGEYGMTELASQLYEGCLPGGALQAQAGVFLAPPWLHVCPVAPETLNPVLPGEVGIARFIDIANVDSAVCIVTQDLIRSTERGFELLGRRHGAVARGCSLSTEEWLQAHAGS